MVMTPSTVTNNLRMDDQNGGGVVKLDEKRLLEESPGGKSPRMSLMMTKAKKGLSAMWSSGGGGGGSGGGRRPSFNASTESLLRASRGESRESLVITEGKGEGVKSGLVVDPAVMQHEEGDETVPLWTWVTTLLSYAILNVVGRFNEFFELLFFPQNYADFRPKEGVAPFFSRDDSFYQRRLYGRIKECWGRPITGIPGRLVKVLERFSTDQNRTFRYTGAVRTLHNLSSYNYLGFTESPSCTGPVKASLLEHGVAVGATRGEGGTLRIHQEIERVVAEFVGKPDAIVLSMGFATNSMVIPALVQSGCCIIADALIHTSLVDGAKTSGAALFRFAHNNMASLEAVLRDKIANGMPRTHRPWRKILVIVEGLYSMEGSIPHLPTLLALKRKYKFYLYADEAHSIGAMGRHGRGFANYWAERALIEETGCKEPPTDAAVWQRTVQYIDEIDILMGTFTKSFGAYGGYIAGDRAVIEFLRMASPGHLFCEPMSPPICQQIISSIDVISGRVGGTEGRDRLRAIHSNSVYFRDSLLARGFIVYGTRGSPVIPLLLFNPAKIAAFSREMSRRGVAVVVVGYPATPMLLSRVRFCISAAHTREDLDYVLKMVDEVGDLMSLKVSSKKQIKK